MRIALKQTQVGLRNSFTRIPFRYGNACMTSCPQAVLQVIIEVAGKQQHGYSGDCLPPGWFDKSPDKDYQRQIQEMLGAISLAERCFSDELAKPSDFFPAWRRAAQSVQEAAAAHQWEPLLASFGVSMVERALLDAMARAASVPFATAVRDNIYGLVPEDVHPELAGMTLADCLPARPAQSLYVRHTVGLSDPLTAADIAPEDRLDDGLPHSLEEYLAQTGTLYFKVKISRDREQTLDRLSTIGSLLERYRRHDFRLTLDGNEQFARAEEFMDLWDAACSRPDCDKLRDATLVIEQPLERRTALDPAHAHCLRELGRLKPIIIDESDSTLDAYPRAIELGYRGVSIKNCKGPIKSLMNAALTWVFNARNRAADYVITGEDLCCVGIVPVQSDLSLAATLGLTHVERNGHHYHRGLSYLPRSLQQAALSMHGDFYVERQGVVAPRLVDGKFHIGSLQCVGCGFAVLPDMESLQRPEEWDFASLDVNDAGST